MEFQLNRTVAPTEQVVTLEQAKNQCNLPISSSGFDNELLLLIDAATGAFERKTRRALLTQTFQYERHYPKCPMVELPRVPCASISAVESKDNLEDAWATVDSADYTTEVTRKPARVTWINNTIPDFVRITYTAGVVSENLVPSEYKLTILQMLCYAFENRGDVNSRFPEALEAMIRSQRAGTVAGFWEQ